MTDYWTAGARDLLKGFHAYVEVSPKEHREEGQDFAIVRDSDYIANSGTDCPVCGSCDCIKGLPEPIAEMGLSCTECDTVWFKTQCEEVEEDKFGEGDIWCKCEEGEHTFGSYPQDGECKCGMHKHHVHCGTCGKISQVG